MDYTVDVIILKESIKEINMTEVLREWGGIMCSLCPAEYVTASGIEFYESQDTDYYQKIIGSDLPGPFLYLHLKSDLLYDLEFSINRDINKLNDNKLMKFFNDLYCLPVFFVFIAREDEMVKDIIKIYTKEDIACAITKCFDWSEPKDILIYKNKDL